MLIYLFGIQIDVYTTTYSLLLNPLIGYTSIFQVISRKTVALKLGDSLKMHAHFLVFFYMGTTFAIFSCAGKIPRLKDKLHIWVSGIVMQSIMFFIMPGFNSSHPAELSLKLEIIFTTSSLFTGIRQRHSLTVCWIKFRGSFWDFGIALDRFEPTLTKNLLNVFDICSLSSIIVPLLSNSWTAGRYYRLFTISFNICQDFFKFDLFSSSRSW